MILTKTICIFIFNIHYTGSKEVGHATKFLNALANNASKNTPHVNECYKNTLKNVFIDYCKKVEFTSYITKKLFDKFYA